MNKRYSRIVGIALILMGLLAVALNVGVPLLGLNTFMWGPWRLWPLAIVGMGLLFVVPPLLLRERSGLAGLFIPGLPVLTTGCILLFCSLFNAWGAWAWLWPLEVIALGVGFLLMAIFMKVIWLLIPAIIIGANGLLFLFCSITGLWGIWGALWTIEPLSLGIAFLIIHARKNIQGLRIAGLILCGFAAVGLVWMSAILRGYWFINMLGPVMLMLVGAGLIFWRPKSKHESLPIEDDLEDDMEEEISEVEEEISE